MPNTCCVPEFIVTAVGMDCSCHMAIPVYGHYVCLQRRCSKRKYKVVFDENERKWLFGGGGLPVGYTIKMGKCLLE